MKKASDVRTRQMRVAIERERLIAVISQIEGMGAIVLEVVRWDMQFPTVRCILTDKQIKAVKKITGVASVYTFSSTRQPVPTGKGDTLPDFQ